MWQAIVLGTWFMSLLLATYLGYERGRWLAGFLLGLLCPGIGFIAAGLLLPSVACEGQRRFDIEQHAAELQQRAAFEARRRRKARAEVEQYVHGVQEQHTLADKTFAEGLQELSQDLDAMRRAEPVQDTKLNEWVGWLQDKASQVKTSPRHQQQEL